MTTNALDTHSFVQLNFCALSCYGANSALSVASANSWTVTDIGASGLRTLTAVQTDAATISNRLAMLVYDLQSLGILKGTQS